MHRTRRRSLYWVLALCSVVFSCSIFVLKRSWNANKELHRTMTKKSIKLLDLVEEISEISHLFENSCKYLWVEDVEPSVKVAFIALQTINKKLINLCVQEFFGSLNEGRNFDELFLVQCQSRANPIHGTNVLQRHIKKVPPVVCSQDSCGLLLRSKDGSFSWFNSSTYSECSVVEMFGGFQNFYNSRKKEKPRHEKIQFDHFHINADVSEITCFDKLGNIISQKTYAGIRNKEDKRLVIQGPPKLPKPKNFDKNKLSISILVLDSTARAQFYRGMPKTLLQMQRMGFLTFHGYNKVADNSAVNLAPILAEQIEEGLRFPMYDEENDINIPRFLPYNARIDPDKLPFIWKRMEKRGCVTMFNDDIMHPSRGLFHYPPAAFKRGFTASPTTHYYRKYYLQIYTDLQKIQNGCLHGDFVHEQFADIWCRFMATYSDRCYFGFSFLTSLTHDNPNDIQLIDGILSERLRLLQEANALNNTLMIIMGDHGNRISIMSKSFAGKIEERQPFLAIGPPPGFEKVYPKAMQNLRINTQRFISNFDLHETLMDVVDNRFETTRPAKRGTSLFLPIPVNRTCVSNSIVKNFCLCMIPEPREQSSPLDYTAMQVSLSKYLHRSQCINNSSVICDKEVDIQIPNEMVRLGMRNKIELPKYEHPESRSEYVYIYQNCTARSTTDDKLRITVQYRSDRRSNYDITFPPMVTPLGEVCSERKSLFAYCSCLKEQKNRS